MDRVGLSSFFSTASGHALLSSSSRVQSRRHGLWFVHNGAWKSGWVWFSRYASSRADSRCKECIEGSRGDSTKIKNVIGDLRH